MSVCITKTPKVFSTTNSRQSRPLQLVKLIIAPSQIIVAEL
jgi:hypothetical protein